MARHEVARQEVAKHEVAKQEVAGQEVANKRWQDKKWPGGRDRRACVCVPGPYVWRKEEHTDTGKYAIRYSTTIVQLSIVVF